MALVNCKKQVKSFATRLTNLRTAIAPKNYEYDVALVGAPRLAIVRTRVLEVQADIDRINRALHLLSEWQAKYAEYIEDVVGEEAAQQRQHCQNSNNVNKSYFTMPKHLLNTTFSYELVCDEMEESPSTAKCLSREPNSTTQGTTKSSVLFPIYIGI